MTDELHASRIYQTQLDAAKAQLAAQGTRVAISQEESSEGFQAWVDEGAFNPMIMARRFEQLETKTRRQSKKEEADKADRKEEEEVLQVQRTEEISEQFQQKNPEIQARSLLMLRARIKQEDTQEEILRKVLEMYPDFSLADEALDFLLQTTKGELATQVRLAKETLNQDHGREVRAGKNIAEQAREFSKQGLGNPSGLRSLYRDVTGNPRDSNTLFNELSSKFTYDKMKSLIDFLLHSLGSDLKSKGPSIPRGELHVLMTETRKLQAILGIFRFFKSRMNLISSAFDMQGIELPDRINFEVLAKLFMKLLQERYPSIEKIFQMAIQLGLHKEWIAQMIIFTQMRDGVRQVAPKLFKSEQHRQEVLKSFIDALEELDEKEEEEEEEEEEKKEKEK